VVLTTGCNTWDDGLDVMVEGKAVQVTDQDTLARLAQAWIKKWDGRWRFEVGEACFPSPGWPRASTRLRGRTRQGARLRQGDIHAHLAPVLTPAPRRALRHCHEGVGKCGKSAIPVGAGGSAETHALMCPPSQGRSSA
jgi:hypothetical protein